MAYQTYVTDAFAVITRILTQGADVPRFYDITHEKKVQPQKSGDEIAAEVIRAAGLRFKEE